MERELKRRKIPLKKNGKILLVLPMRDNELSDETYNLVVIYTLLILIVL